MRIDRSTGWKFHLAWITLLVSAGELRSCDLTHSAADNTAAGAAVQRFTPAANIQTAPLAACFAPGTPDWYVELITQRLLANTAQQRYNLAGRWPGTQGSPLTLTWSFVPDGLNIGSGIGEPAAPSELFARMDALFLGNRALWISRFQESFDRWSQLTGITYVRRTSGGNDWDDGAFWGASSGASRGDVRISMKNIDGGSNVLAYNFYPSNGDMVLDRSESWANSANSHRFMRNIIMHEHGHGIGIEHVCPTNSSKLMEPFLATNFDGPQHDDIRAGQFHYGDPLEEDNTSANATDLGFVIPNVPIVVGAVPPPSAGTQTSILSIDANSEQDWYRFNLPEALQSLEVLLTPVGKSYGSNPQVGGSCTSGNFISSLTQADLDLDLRASDGTTVLALSNSQPSGMPESVIVDLPAGNYFARVFDGAGSPSGTQLYTLTISAPECVSNSDCDDAVACNGFETCDAGHCQPGETACAAELPLCCEAADECQVDCNNNDEPDGCEIGACGGLPACGDCNFNLVPDQCDIAQCSSDPACADCNGNGIPDGCDLATCEGDPACCDLNGNNVPDVCDAPPMLVPESAPMAKPRFVSFNLPLAGVGENTAIRVELVGLYDQGVCCTPGDPNACGNTACGTDGDCAAPFTECTQRLLPFQGEFRYVNSIAGSTTCDDALGETYRCAVLGCQPEYRDWSSELGAEVLYVTGDAIAPGSAFSISNLAELCGPAPAANSCPAAAAGLVVSTGIWGDVGSGGGGPPDSFTNVIDIGLVSDKVKGLASALPEPSCWLKQQSPAPQATPVNVIDIGLTSDAVKGFPYPYSMSACP